MANDIISRDVFGQKQTLYKVPTDEELKKMSTKGLPDAVTHPAVTGATYPWNVPPAPTPLESQNIEGSRTAGMAGFKPTGLANPVKVNNPTTTENTNNTNAPIANTTISDGGFKPYSGTPEERQNEIQGLVEGGHVFTNADLNKYYGARGLPEAGQNVTSYYRDTMEKLNDRASHLADTIEAGFVSGKRLTAAVAELQSLHARIGGIEGAYGEAMGIPSKIGLTEAQTQEQLSTAGKLKRETDIMPTTNQQAYEQATGIAEIKAKQDRSEQMKAKRQEQVDKALLDITKDNITYPDEKSKQDAISAVYAQFPELNPMGNTGGNVQKSKSKSGKPIINRGNGWEYE